MTQQKIAQSLNISFQALQKYERGDIRVSASRLLQLSRLLGQPVAFFFRGLDVPAPLEGARTEIVQAELELLRAFRALADADLRRTVMRFIRSMANTMGSDVKKREKRQTRSPKS